MEDFNSKYSGEQVEALLDQVASGNAGGGGTPEVYIADFTMESLRDGMYNVHQVTCDMQALVAAMNANKIILVRESESSDYKGVYVLNGYVEDLLYFSIVDSQGDVLYCDGTDCTSPYIDGRDLYFHHWWDKQDTLVSGENIKTINGESIVGSGNIEISGGSGERGPQGDKGDKGDTGVGVQSVAQTTTSNADGGSNVVTVTLTDGTKSTFTVKNGSKGSSGSNGTNGTNGKDGADGEEGATFTPSVDSAGNLSWTNNKGLTNPPTVNIKGPKGDAGEGGGGSSGGGKEVIVSNVQSLYFDETTPVRANTIYINSGSSFSIYIGAFEVASNYDEYHIIFRWPESGFLLPDDVKFANGEKPTIEYDTVCELHIVGVTMGAERVYNAVLTPFKPVE